MLVAVVRMLVFGRRTFCGLHSNCGWQVTTSCVNCPLWDNQLGQLSLPSLWDW